MIIFVVVVDILVLVLLAVESIVCSICKLYREQTKEMFRVFREMERCTEWLVSL